MQWKFYNFKFAVLAVVFGIIAIVYIRKNKETLKGTGIAIAGIILGMITIFTR